MQVRGIAVHGAGFARSVVTRARAAARANGAGESGLARLLELHAISSTGDALVAIGLAGSLFFGVPVGQARTKVALYLALTMAPFALLAPLIGPALDRARRGRRAAIGTTLVARAVLAIMLGEALQHSDALQLYPAAFGLLVLSKAYGVARSSALPRLLPAPLTLVRANARVTLSGLIPAAIAAPIGGGLAKLAGPEWTLWLAATAFGLGTVLTFSLPPHVDSAPGEGWTTPGVPPPRRRALLLPRDTLGATVRPALVAAASMRWLNGFLTVFLAFLIRSKHGIGGLPSGVSLGLVIGGAALGGLLGTSSGTRLSTRTPMRLATSAVVLAAAASWIAVVFYGLPAVLALAVVTGLTQAVTKLALDSLIQREVAEGVRSSAFSVSESTLQLAWVIGGLVGILLPLNATVGLSVAATAVVVAIGWTLRFRRGSQPADRPAVAG